MPTDPRETRLPTDDASAAGLQVLRRFHVPLRTHPGLAALYALVEDASAGHRRLRWDGVAALSRIPPQYGSRPLSHSDACPRQDGPSVRESP